ncbi:MAG: carbohydrate-binding domain-containing protein [Bacteroidaceae bacterium]|nr:carbohydrate-binding domain-containing protein [Bacteroidaceae bacterium]
MKKVLSFIFSLLIMVACTQQKAPVTASHDILDSIPKEKPVLEEKYNLDKSKYDKVVDIIFDNGVVQHSKLPQGVSAQIDGGDIRLASHISGVEFRLSGLCNNGSIALTSDSSVLVTLGGVALASRKGTPMKINCREVAFVQCIGRATSYLVDAPCDAKADTVKSAAALETMGEVVLCGGGKLALYGKRRYAINGVGRLLINDIVLMVESSVRDAISMAGGIAFVKGNIHINSTKDAIKAKKGNVLFLDGNISLNATGEKGDGVQADNIYMYGSNVSIKTSGDASRGFNAKGSVYILDGSLSVLTSGSATFSPKKIDYSSNACIKCEKAMYVGGGYVNLENSATAGKGINCNGKLQMNDGILLVRNYGEDIVHPTIADAHASAKGIKCDSTIAINGGKIEVLVFGKDERCEGMESKDEIVVSGDASIYVYASDDAINCGGNLTMNGGKLYAYSAQNDGIDGNTGIIINGGTIIANGSGSPEQGIDCDFDGNLRVTGGTIVSIGGMMGKMPNVPRNKFSTQQAVAWSGIELQRDKYINLCDDKGNVILSYKLPRSIARAGVVISSPQLKKEGTYTLSTSDTPAGGTHMGNGLFAEGKCTTADDAKSFTIESLITRVDAEGNIEAIAADTADIGKGMMMPPPPFAKGEGGPGMPPPDFKPGMAPPPFDINNIPDSIKKRFPFPADGKMPFPPPFEGMRGKDEGYNVNNLPGGGW